MEILEINTLIHNLQSKDSDYKKAFRILQIFFFVFILLYLVLYVFNPYTEMSLIQRIGGGCYVLAFSLLAFHFRNKYIKSKLINYSVSVKELMIEAEKRFRFWQNNKLDSILSIILFDMGTCLILSKYSSDKWSLLMIFISVQVFCLISAAIGFIIGFINWKKNIRPLWVVLKTQLNEFENN